MDIYGWTSVESGPEDSSPVSDRLPLYVLMTVPLRRDPGALCFLRQEWFLLHGRGPAGRVGGVGGEGCRGGRQAVKADDLTEQIVGLIGGAGLQDPLCSLPSGQHRGTNTAGPRRNRSLVAGL